MPIFEILMIRSGDLFAIHFQVERCKMEIKMPV